MLHKEKTPASYTAQGHNQIPSGNEISLYLSAKQRKQERSALCFGEEETEKKVGTKPDS